MRRAGYVLSLIFCLIAAVARAAHTQATLVLSDDTAAAGETVWAGVLLKMDPEWHTYWKNSGEAGMPTTITWQLPPGVTAGDIEWPLPEKLPPAEVTTYGYSGETMLLVPLKIGPTARTMGPITLTANLTWLECKDVCIPEKATVQATLNIGSETKRSVDAAEIEAWKEKIPVNRTNDNFRAWWDGPANDDTRPLVIEGPSAPGDHYDFFPYGSDQFDVQPETTVVNSDATHFQLRKLVKKFAGGWPSEVSGVIVDSSSIVNQARSGRSGLEVHLPIANEAPSGMSGGAQSSAEGSALANGKSGGQVVGQTSGASLIKYLLYAFIGGLILNIMPCVLPVIALKILGFVSEARSEPKRVRNLGFVYAAGVLSSFAAMAGIVIGIKAAGHHAGWGMQFGSPIFVVCLTILVTLVALNLFGVFEVTPGGKVLDAAGHLASKHGAPGAFFNGLLATTLATPCTAPYLAGALAFAFAQTAGVILLVFLFVGIGLAAPYVLLSCNPALLKFLPKPGPWME
ncbi:MAG TPA: protein-disulfide reductase DsbD domain-containing protein, partial [Verrucomicrobiae bacterium]|nr:protein-disulfide reductase DsbD domain-containing protein [Verrucomicrobiae bacterium]